MSCFKKLTNSYLHLVKTAENWDDYSWNKNYERMYGGGRRRKNIEKNMQKAFGIESSECKIFPYDLLYFRPHSLSDVQSTEGGGGRHKHSCHTHTKHHIHTTHTYRHIDVEFMNTSLGVGYTEEMACGKCGQTPDVATCCSCSCLSASLPLPDFNFIAFDAFISIGFLHFGLHNSSSGSPHLPLLHLLSSCLPNLLGLCVIKCNRMSEVAKREKARAGQVLSLHIWPTFARHLTSFPLSL